MPARRRGLPAGAGVGSQDQLKTCWKTGMHLTAAECDHAGFQRCTQRLEDSRLEFRRLIEKKHALVSTRDRAGLCYSLAATDDAGNGGRVVRVAVGRSSDQLISEIEAGKGVHR
jgi:hypothetical protein